ncbi:MAG: hypothetical protein JWO15_3653 [Sphingomonadales bacterium]|nr:hypothetical protein [Sphingomonadales bacterium]
MAKNCGCAGSTCGCRVIGGIGIEVTGIGTAINPYVVTRDTTTDSINQQIKFNNSTTVELSKLGSGTAADPIILKAQVVLVSPNGARWTLQVSNTGALSTLQL